MTNRTTGQPGDDGGISVLVVDDHALLAESLAAALATEGKVTVKVAAHVDAAMAAIAEHGKFDVVLLDYEGTGMDGLDGLTRLEEANEGHVALFSGVASRSVVDRAIAAGASGFIPKTTPLRTLGHVIRLIADGDIYLPADYMLNAQRNDGAAHGLKPRELQVLILLCEGLQNKEIGRELGVEETIVKMDLKSVFRKLEVRNRTQAVIAARDQGIV